MPLTAELDTARRLAREAGELLLAVYATEFRVVYKPSGGGPVTEADERANALIVDGLRRAFPGDGVVAEETKDTSDAGRFARCWYVDPLDGTSEFVKRNGEFAVHIGLAVEGKAAVGVVYQPVGDRLYAGAIGSPATVEAEGASRRLQVRPPPDKLCLVVSRSHRSPALDQIRERAGVGEVLQLGSVGLKCAKIAEGAADFYVHVSDRSYRWDACAPEAVLRAAGGVFTDLTGAPYRYDGTELRNARGLLAGSPAAIARVAPLAEELARRAGLNQ